ncbi:MAG: toprim domain-containing protein [Desulfobacteraceae bacterium]|nr:toprim domain-containing protein [Desulfobacteraceae bacterium]
MQSFSDLGIEIPAGTTGEARTTCPQCSGQRRKSKDKCLAVNVAEGAFFCHHCGWSGGLKKEDEKPLNAEPKTYRKPEYKPAPSLPEKVIEYFKTRKIPEAILTANKIGYGKSWADKGGIQFPYFKGGAVVNVKHRSHDKQFRQEKEAEKCLYRFDEIAKLAGDALIITEGEIDALSVQAAGFEMVTSIPAGAPSPGAKSYTTKFDFLKSAEEVFKSYKRIILAMDADAPGRTAEVELARRIGPEKCYRVKYPEGCKDANDVLVKHGEARLMAIIEGATPYPVSGLFRAEDFVSDIQRRYDEGIQRGLATGFTSLDGLYFVKEGRLCVVTGIPGHGKSTFVDNLCILLAMLYGFKVAVFSPENWQTDNHLAHLLPKVAGKPFRQTRYSNRMSPAEMQKALDFLNEHFFFIVPEEDILSVDVILEKARVAIFRHGIKGLIIDPWNEVEHNYSGQTEAQYLSLQLTKIRRFARQYGIHVWIIAHPRNLIKDKLTCSYSVPTMYEISGGAHWRNKADIGLCVHRPNLNDDVSEIIIQKMRFCEEGRIGKASLKYIRDTEQFEDV